MRDHTRLRAFELTETVTTRVDGLKGFNLLTVEKYET